MQLLKAGAGGYALLVNRALLLASTKSNLPQLALLTRPIVLICDLRPLLWLLALIGSSGCLAAHVRSLKHFKCTST